MKKAESYHELYKSVKEGRFTVDGADLPIADFVYPPDDASSTLPEYEKLIDLTGCPKSVIHCYCDKNYLSDLVGGPTDVKSSYDCSTNNLITLKGAPSYIIGMFDCCNNHLSSLEYGPTSVNKDYIARENNITTLNGFPKKVGRNFYLTHNQLTSLHNIHQYTEVIGNMLVISDNPIKECILGVLLIKHIKSVNIHDNQELSNIINRYISLGKEAVYKCAQDLVKANLKDLARL